MPTEPVPCAVEPARLLALHPPIVRPVVLDGSGHDSWGDGSALLTGDPRATLTVSADGGARVIVDGVARRWTGQPLQLWQRFLTEMPALMGAAGDPDAAGFVTALSYDLKHWIESLPRRHPFPSYPILYCAFHDWYYRYDHHTGRATVHAQTSVDVERRFRLEGAASAALGGAEAPPSTASRRGGIVDNAEHRLHPQLDKETYCRKIEAIQRYIAAGDVYQVNFAQPFITAADARAAPVLFARLQREFPMPFAAYLDAGDFIAVSASPECFLSVESDQVATFPIKGTRALSDGSTAALRADAKEWAEHVMIVDLERNDLGRVCRCGTVTVVDFGAVHTYPLLAHIVSHVRGRLRSGVSLAELMMATFPGGSITGAPKIRAMQIIEELEVGPRGMYTGAIGWTDLRGNSRFNLAIRTAVFAGGTLTYHAGGGIVADSDAAREYEETLLKSEAMFRALRAHIADR